MIYSVKSHAEIKEGYSRGPNKSDALNRSDGWKNVKKLIRAMAPNKSDAWKTQSLPVQIHYRHKWEKKHTKEQDTLMNMLII